MKNVYIIIGCDIAEVFMSTPIVFSLYGKREEIQ